MKKNEESRPLSAADDVAKKERRSSELSDDLGKRVRPKSLGAMPSRRYSDQSYNLNEVSYHEYTANQTLLSETAKKTRKEPLSPLPGYSTFRNSDLENPNKRGHMRMHVLDLTITSHDDNTLTTSLSRDQLETLSSEPSPFVEDAFCSEPEGHEPVMAYCTRCRQRVITIVTTERTKTAYIIFIVLFMLLIWPFCLLPLYLKKFKIPVHHCSCCGLTLSRVENRVSEDRATGNEAKEKKSDSSDYNMITSPESKSN